MEHITYIYIKLEIDYFWSDVVCNLLVSKDGYTTNNRLFICYIAHSYCSYQAKYHVKQIPTEESSQGQKVSAPGVERLALLSACVKSTSTLHGCW